MLQVTVTSNTRPLDEAAQFFDQIQLNLQQIGDEVQRQIEPRLLEELAYYPGPAVHPFVWSVDPIKNAKARRYYFAAVGRGDIPTSGGRYARTGAYGRSWYVDQAIEGGAFVLRIGSTYPKAGLIGGSLNQRSVAEAAAFQIPGHSTTGWPIQAKTINFWVDASIELWVNSVLDRLENLVLIEKTTRRSKR